MYQRGKEKKSHRHKSRAPTRQNKKLLKVPGTSSGEGETLHLGLMEVERPIACLRGGGTSAKQDAQASALVGEEDGLVSFSRRARRREADYLYLP